MRDLQGPRASRSEEVAGFDHAEAEDQRRRTIIAASTVAVSAALLGLLSAGLAGAREMFNLASTQRLVIDRVVTDNRLTDRPWLLHASLLLAQGAIALAVVSGSIAAYRRSGLLRAGTAVIGTVAAVLLADHVLKPLVDRRVVVDNAVIGEAMFPSGHATALWAATLELLAVGPGASPDNAFAYRRIASASVGAVAALASAFLVIARTHYLTDVIGGLFLGVAVAMTARLVLARIESSLAGLAR